jgi:hypothetical protein
MSLQDTQLTCVTCDEKFVFTAGERQLLRFHGRDREPEQCPVCRRRSARATTGSVTTGSVLARRRGE